MSFSAQMLDFLSENVMRDDKEWFKANKAEFERLVMEPMRRFSVTVLPYITAIDSGIDKIHISRIYRDTRFVHGGSVFRENMWVSFGRVKDLYKSLPAFYFDISPNGAEYGCGYYVPPDGAMQRMRETIVAGDPGYIAANDALKASSFELYGDKYKRSKFPDRSDEEREWLERKSIGVFRRRTDWDAVFSDDFADIVGKDLSSVKDIYHFLYKAAV